MIIHLFRYDDDNDHTAITSASTTSTASTIAENGGTAVISNSHIFTTSDTKYVSVCADSNASYGGTITESDETNNCSSWTAVTVGTGAPSASAPTVTTQAVSSINSTTAIGNGTVVSDGGSVILERGIVISTNQNPTTADTKFIVFGTTGVFSASLSGLTSNTPYYHVRAYAINAINVAGTASYGDDVTFRTTAPPPVVVNGACSSTHYNCSSGTDDLNSNTSSPSKWTWTCLGSGDGVFKSCSEVKSPGFIEK